MKYLSLLSLLATFTAFSTGVQADAAKPLVGKLRAAVTEQATKENKVGCGACFKDGAPVRISAAAAGNAQDPKAFLMVVTPQAPGCDQKCEVTIMKTPDMEL